MDRQIINYMMKMLRLILPCLIIFSAAGLSQSGPGTVTISADLSKKTGNFKPAWAWFGYDEPNYTYMKDGRKLLSELSALSPVPVYVRAHNLLNTGDAAPALKWGSTNVYTEDANGNPVYDWTIIDKIFDTYIERGMKPLAEIGFMPEALSSNPQPYRHYWKPGDPYDDIYTGWRYPPNDYKKWGELIYRWVSHSVERYGRKEVESWYWELWNEPDSKYWGGSVEEYCKLYDYSADAVKRALPSAKVGGPHVTGPAGANAGKFLTEFLNHCESGINAATGKIGAPLDFIAFHAKGAPRFISDMVRMNMGAELRQVESGFRIIASKTMFKDLPVIIGECDPEGCAACGMTQYPQNGYRNGTMYSSYTASSFAKIYDLANAYKINLRGIVTWAFEFEDQPWFHGFRDLATNGIDKPVLNVFRMFGMMGPDRVEAGSSGGYDFKTVIDSGVRGNRTEIGTIASRDRNYGTIMFWNYHDDDNVSPDAGVILNISGIPSGRVRVTTFMIDREHSNSYELWKKMGSPQKPSSVQYSALERAGMLATDGRSNTLRVKDGMIKISKTISRQGVGMVKLEWK